MSSHIIPLTFQMYVAATFQNQKKANKEHKNNCFRHIILPWEERVRNPYQSLPWCAKSENIKIYDTITSHFSFTQWARII